MCMYVCIYIYRERERERERERVQRIPPEAARGEMPRRESRAPGQTITSTPKHNIQATNNK